MEIKINPLSQMPSVHNNSKTKKEKNKFDKSKKTFKEVLKEEIRKKEEEENER